MSSVLGSGTGVDVGPTSAGFGCKDLDDDDNDAEVSAASPSSGGNSNLTTRSKTLIHLNTKHGLNCHKKRDQMNKFNVILPHSAVQTWPCT